MAHCQGSVDLAKLTHFTSPISVLCAPPTAPSNNGRISSSQMGKDDGLLTLGRVDSLSPSVTIAASMSLADLPPSASMSSNNNRTVAFGSHWKPTSNVTLNENCFPMSGSCSSEGRSDDFSLNSNIVNDEPESQQIISENQTDAGNRENAGCFTGPDSSSVLGPLDRKSIRKSNTSGFNGVCWLGRRNGWLAHWYEDGIQRKKFFASHKYGNQGAKERACQFRIEQEERVRRAKRRCIPNISMLFPDDEFGRSAASLCIRQTRPTAIDEDDAEIFAPLPAAGTPAAVTSGLFDISDCSGRGPSYDNAGKLLSLQWQGTGVPSADSGAKDAISPSIVEVFRNLVNGVSSESSEGRPPFSKSSPKMHSPDGGSGRGFVSSTHIMPNNRKSSEPFSPATLESEASCDDPTSTQSGPSTEIDMEVLVGHPVVLSIIMNALAQSTSISAGEMTAITTMPLLWQRAQLVAIDLLCRLATTNHQMHDREDSSVLRCDTDPLGWRRDTKVQSSDVDQTTKIAIALQRLCDSLKYLVEECEEARDLSDEKSPYSSRIHGVRWRCAAWVASWFDADNGERVAISFPASQYGFSNAKKMAINRRILAELNGESDNQTRNITDEHNAIVKTARRQVLERYNTKDLNKVPMGAALLGITPLGDVTAPDALPVSSTIRGRNNRMEVETFYSGSKRDDASSDGWEIGNDLGASDDGEFVEFSSSRGGWRGRGSRRRGRGVRRGRGRGYSGAAVEDDEEFRPCPTLRTASLEEASTLPNKCSAANTSAVPARVQDRPVTGICWNGAMNRWIVRWVEHGRERRRHFRVEIHGYDEAYQLAVKLRQEMEVNFPKENVSGRGFGRRRRTPMRGGARRGRNRNDEDTRDAHSAEDVADWRESIDPVDC